MHTDLTIGVGSAFAKSAHLSIALGQNEVLVNGQLVHITAIVAGTNDSALASTAIILTPTAAKELRVLPASQVLAGSVSKGAVAAVADMLPSAINARSPGSVSTSYPPVAATLTGRVSAESSQLVLVVSLIAGLMAVLSVIASMQIAVWERRKEIGILRSIGVSRGYIGRQFILEAALLGNIGSSAGWVAGILIGSLVALFSSHVLLVPLWVLGIPLMGTILGMAAGIVPSLRASRLDPIILLRE